MDRGFGGGSLVNFSQLGQGQTCFIRNRGRVTDFFFGKEKLLHVPPIFVKKHTKCIEISKLYIQAKLPVETNLNYLQVSKYYIKKLSCSTNILSLSIRARFRPNVDGGKVSVRGSGIKSVSGNDSLLTLGLTRQLDVLHHFASNFNLGK